MQTIRLFMLLEAASFVAASLIHSGVLITGFEHPEARIAEGVIAAVLIVDLILSFIRQAWTRRAGLATQGFALVGTLVGLFTIAIGVGRRTAPDLVYHAAILAVIVWGLVFTAQSRPHLAD
jgi:hypothetical protein